MKIDFLDSAIGLSKYILINISLSLTNTLCNLTAEGAELRNTTAAEELFRANAIIKREFPNLCKYEFSPLYRIIGLVWKSG